MTSILSRLVQALLNLSMTSLGADKGSDILVEGGALPVLLEDEAVPFP